jgi:hypothetical protein
VLSTALQIVYLPRVYSSKGIATSWFATHLSARGIALKESMERTLTMPQQDDDIPSSDASALRPSKVPPYASDTASPIRAHSQTHEPEIIRLGDSIYHVKRTAARRTNHLRPGIYEFDVCDSFTDYFSAVRLAYTLELMGTPSANLRIYCQEDFAAEDWTYGLGCLVHALADNGDVFTIEIEVEDGKVGTLGDEYGRVYWPLFFVVKAEIYRDAADMATEERGDGFWRYESRIQSSWTTPRSARLSAEGAWSKGKVRVEQFQKYDAFHDGRVSTWGSNVVVSAVDNAGRYIFIAVLRSWRAPGDSREAVVSFS